jgi:hypothetical protein
MQFFPKGSQKVECCNLPIPSLLGGGTKDPEEPLISETRCLSESHSFQLSQRAELTSKCSPRSTSWFTV